VKLPAKAGVVARIAFAAVAVAGIAVVVAVNWVDFVSAIARMDPLLVAGSIAAAVAAVVFSMLSWRSMVGAFGFPVGLRDAAAIVFVSQIGKYVPGAIWPIVAGTELGRSAGLPRAVTAGSLAAQLLVSLASSAAISLGLVFTVPELTTRYGWLSIALVAAVLIVLSPPVLTRLVRLGLRITRRVVEVSIRPVGVAASLVWSVASWLAFGLHIWLLVAAVGSPGPAQLLPSVSGYALAWLAGFVAVIAPAGAGVRELVLALALGPVVQQADLLGVVLVSRMLLVAVDIALCLVGRRAWRHRGGSTTGARREPPAG
jgi:glycosyltransferase 2 family protein